MNQGFKLRYDQLKDNDPTGPDEGNRADTGDRYASGGHTRNLCLVWPDGKRAFLNYAYLIEAEFEPGSDKNVIKLNFSAYAVILHGFGLETLFMALLDHLPRIITAADERYAIEPERSMIVTNIIVSEQH